MPDIESAFESIKFQLMKHCGEVDEIKDMLKFYKGKTLFKLGYFDDSLKIFGKLVQKSK